MYRILFVGAVIVGLVLLNSLSISAQTVETSTVVEDGSVSSTPPAPPTLPEEKANDVLTETEPSSLVHKDILKVHPTKKAPDELDLIYNELQAVKALIVQQCGK